VLVSKEKRPLIMIENATVYIFSWVIAVVGIFMGVLLRDETTTTVVISPVATSVSTSIAT
jgi:hypothetical protein